MFYDYVYTNDMTLSRVFRLEPDADSRRSWRCSTSLNLSTIYTRNETFGPQWYNPIDLVQARRFQFGAQVDW